MNQDILKGSWLEIKGKVKEKWGRLTDNELGVIEGKDEKLLGLLRKKYGYIRDKAEPEYQDTVELAETVSRIREILKRNDNLGAMVFIARYGQPLSAKNQERPITGKDEKHGHDTDRYSYTRLSRRNTHLASQ